MTSVNVQEWTEKQNKMANVVLHHYFDRWTGTSFNEKQETEIYGSVLVEKNQISFTVKSKGQNVNASPRFHNYRMAVVEEAVYIYYRKPQGGERSRSYIFTDDKSLTDREQSEIMTGNVDSETYFLDKAVLV